LRLKPDHEGAQSASAALYEKDFYAWAYEQATALRAARDLMRPGRNKPLENLDWENLAEEIEGLAQRDRRELESRIALIIEHLTKLRHSPARDPRAGWTETVGRSRRDIQRMLNDSPSLRRQLPALIEGNASDAVRLAARSLIEHGEIDATAASRLVANYTLEQVVDDWWPEPLTRPPAAGRRSQRAGARRQA
jgi:Domain of unknown function DUF29